MNEDDFYFEVEWAKPRHLVDLFDIALSVLRPMKWCWRTNLSGDLILPCKLKNGIEDEIQFQDFRSPEVQKCLAYAGADFYSPAAASFGIGNGCILSSETRGSTAGLFDVQRLMLGIGNIGYGWIPTLWHSGNSKKTEELYRAFDTLAQAWNADHLFGYPRPRHSDGEPMGCDHAMFYFGKKGEKRIKYIEEKRAPTQQERAAVEEWNFSTAPWLT